MPVFSQYQPPDERSLEGFYHTAIQASKSKYLQIIGFSVLLLLFCIPIGIGLSLLQRDAQNITIIVDNHNVKTALVNQMIHAARARSLLLYQMLSIDDPFERDELFMRLNKHGAEFAQARTRLLAMKLIPKEKEFLNRQGKLTGIAVPQQRAVVDMIQQDRIREARQQHVLKAVPAQNAVMEELGHLQKLQQESARLLAEQNRYQIDNALSIILLLSLLALAFGLLIAFYVTFRSTMIEQRLFMEKELAQVTLHSIADAVITTDRNGMIKYLNPNAEKLTGWTLHNALGHELHRVFNTLSSRDKDDDISPITQTLTQGKVVLNQEDAQLIHSDGKDIPIEYSSAPILDQNRNIHGAVIIFRDVTEMRSLAYQLSYQATHDSLTGLINRREFERRLQQALGNARAEHINYALLYLDLDQFKVINDTCGHVAGDELLKQLAVRLRSVLRDSDILARLGGDEFGVLLQSCSVSKAVEIAESLRQQVRSLRFAWDDKSFEVGVSTGIVPITPASGTVSDALSAADTACYESKDQGRNHIHVYHPHDSNLVKRRGEMHWVHRIHESLESDKFTLYCHRVEELSAQGQSRMLACEILLRLQDSDGRIIPPMAFLPAAERYNLMPVIDQYVVTKTFKQLSPLMKQFAPFRIFINLSGQSICESDFADFVMDEIEDTGIAAENIVFEITETAAIANFSRATHFIKTLKKRGCQFALDDFGSGLSSFAYLKNMAVDYLKIDGTFVRDILKDETDAAFVEAIHQIGKVMGIHTIAEYVENEATLTKLKSLGINYAQGYHLGKPEPLAEVLDGYLQKHSHSRQVK